MNKHYDDSNNWINLDKTVDMPHSGPKPEYIPSQKEYNPHSSPVNPFEGAKPAEPVSSSGYTARPQQYPYGTNQPQQPQPQYPNGAYQQPQQQSPYGANQPQQSQPQHPNGAYQQPQQQSPYGANPQFREPDEFEVPFSEQPQAAQGSDVYIPSDEYSSPAPQPIDPTQAEPESHQYYNVQPGPARPVYGNPYQPYNGEEHHHSQEETGAHRKKQKKAGRHKKAKIVFLSILAVFVAIIIAGYFMLFYDPNALMFKKLNAATTTEVPSATVIAGGAAYTAVVDENGVTYAAVPDDEGHIWQANINADGSLGETVGSLDGVFDTTTTAEGGIEESVNIADFTGEAEEVAESDDTSVTTAQSDEASDTTASGNDSAGTTAASGKSGDTTAVSGDSTTAKSDKSTTAGSDKNTTKSNDTTAAANQTFYFTKYQQMFSAGTYYIEFTTNESDLEGGKVVTAGKNGNAYFTTSYRDMKCSVLYIARNDMSYLILDDMQQYCSLPEDILGESVEMEDLNILNSVFSDKISPAVLTSKEVKINGRTLTCESCETTDGIKYDYYFNNGRLVRIDLIDNNDGTSYEVYISRISTNVDDSVFSVPDGYDYVNFSWIKEEL